MSDIPEFYAILTEAGRALQFECMNSDKQFVMSEMAVGDGNGSYYEPEKTQADLKNECYRHAITRKMTDKKGLVKSIILDIPEDIYGFTIREVGVFGENGELLLVGKYPATPKLKPESGAISQLAIKMNLTQINELVLPVLIDPSVNTASVQYVEEYFQKLEEKAKPNGYASLDENGLVPIKQLSNVLPTFCFNSGAVDSQGNSALMTVENDTLTLNAPSVGTTAGGETFTVSENVTLDISTLADGKYNCFYNPETGGLEIYNNEIFEQKSEPENWNIGDIWVNTSIMPNVSYKKVSESEKVVTKLVQTADLERVSAGGGGSFEQ